MNTNLYIYIYITCYGFFNSCNLNHRNDRKKRTDPKIPFEKKKVETIISPFKINLIDDIMKRETPKYSLHKVFYISY